MVTKQFDFLFIAYSFRLNFVANTHECLLDGESVSLTPTEFSILQVLLESAGNVVSIEELFHAVWKDEYYSKNSSTITVHIRHLREKQFLNAYNISST